MHQVSKKKQAVSTMPMETKTVHAPNVASYQNA